MKIIQTLNILQSSINAKNINDDLGEGYLHVVDDAGNFQAINLLNCLLFAFIVYIKLILFCLLLL